MFFYTGTRLVEIAIEPMSRVEIAGFLLGAIPYVIAALKHYEVTLDPTIAFIRWN